jgi:hypothetical protein
MAVEPPQVMLLALCGYLQFTKIPKLGKAEGRILLMEEKLIFPEGKPPSGPRWFPARHNFGDKLVFLIHREFFPIQNLPQAAEPPIQLSGNDAGLRVF